MSFDNLPDLGPFLLGGAQAHSERAFEMSKLAVPHLRSRLDQSYGAHAFQTLDLFLPHDSTVRAAPIMVFFHGGAWRHGYKEWQGFMAPPLVTLPAIFVSANYRLAPAAKMPTLFADCCDAVAWVWRNAERLGGDPNRIFVAGHSAGGHLAALLTLRGDALAARGLPAGCIKGCLPISAVFDLRRQSPGSSSLPDGLLNIVLEPECSGEAYSPMSHASNATTRFFVTYGSRDEPFSIQQSRAFVQLLRSRGGTVEEHVAPDSSHFDTNLLCADERSVWVSTARRWLAGG